MELKKHILESVHHVIVGFFLIMKGGDKYSHHQIVGGIIIAFGIIILSYFFYEMKKTRPGQALRILVHVFEGIALLFTACIFLGEGKVYLPYATLMASLGFFISAALIFLKIRKTES